MSVFHCLNFKIDVESLNINYVRLKKSDDTTINSYTNLSCTNRFGINLLVE